MSALDRIAIRVDDDADAAPSAMVPAVLREVEALLAELVASGRNGRIDLRSLPLLPGDDARLAEALGAGEVRAEIDAMGRSQVRETALPGVWWVTHANTDGETVAEFIEIAPVPEILKAHPDDTRAGLARLRERLAAGGPIRARPRRSRCRIRKR